jgi:hypothetical protein
MASQVAHIIYAHKYFEKVPNHGIADRDKFLLGCTFPDIRRIDGNIKRKDTHLRFSPIDLNFEGLDDFQAGWKFHLYCDMRREEILNDYDFYSLPSTTEFYNQPAKMLEDEVIYDSYNNWEKIVQYFNNPPQIDNGIGVSRETFDLWYAILAKYFEKKPDNNSIKILFSKFPSLANIAKEVVSVVDELRKDVRVIEILKRVKEEIV